MSPLSRDRDGPVGRFILRPATRADLDALVALEEAAFAGDRLSRRSLARLVGVRSAVVLVGVFAGQVVASAVVLLRSYSSRARLYSLAVAPSVRGRGFGAALLEAAERAAAARGATALTLEMRADNEAARQLYERHGFAAAGRSPGYYSDGEAALHFRKALEPPAAEETRAA